MIIVAILVIYMIGMLYIGYRGKRDQSMKEYLTAGGKNGLFLMTCAYLGSTVGNGVFVGGAQNGFNYGVGGIWFGVGSVLALVLFGVIMSKRLHRAGVITVPQLIIQRYDSKIAAVIIAILSISCGIGLMASQFLAGAALFSALGLNAKLGIVLLGAVVILYCGFSGMWGVVMTDSIQAVVMLFGASFCIITIAMSGGLDTISATLPPSNFEAIPFDAETFLMMLIPSALIGLISGASFQRNASCKDEKTAFWSPILGALASLPFVIIPVIIGMYGKALFPDTNSASILFRVVIEKCHPVLAGLMLAAILAAVMSTVDIVILHVCANLVHDIYAGVINPKAEEKKLSKLTVFSTFAVGLIGLIISLQFSNIISLISSAYSLQNAGSLVMVLGALFWNKGTKEGAIAGAVAGVTVVLLEKLGVPIPYISLTPFIPSLAVYIIVSLFTQKKQSN